MQGIILQERINFFHTISEDLTRISGEKLRREIKNLLPSKLFILQQASQEILWKVY